MNSANDNTQPQKYVLITGGTRGIGRGIGEILLENGFNIIITGVSSEKLPAETETAFKNAIIKYIEKNKDASDSVSNVPKFSYIRSDISKLEDRIELLKKIRALFGRLDVLVNNAGVAPNERRDILEMTEESYDRVMHTNLKGPFFLTQLVANYMKELVLLSASSDNSDSATLSSENSNAYSPKIINISSISSYTSSPNRAEYCISKAGLSMMTKLYADRLAQYGIGVFEIQPGIIETDMTSGVKEKYDELFKKGLTPIKRWGTPKDIGKAVLSVCLDLYPYSTGQVFNVDGGFHLHRL